VALVEVEEEDDLPLPFTIFDILGNITGTVSGFFAKTLSILRE